MPQRTRYLSSSKSATKQKEALKTTGNLINSLITLVGEFRSEARAKSNLFAFWDQYLSVVMTLLQFIKAERTGD